jgi:hypothetical protein
MLEFVMRAGTRNAYENLMKSHGFMKGDGTLKPDIISDPASNSPEYAAGIPIEQGAYHINIRMWGVAEAAQTAGFDQYDAQGNLLPQYMRTKFGNLVYKTGKPWTAANGVTKGATLSNVTVIYLSTIASRKRVWQ